MNDVFISIFKKITSYILKFWVYNKKNYLEIKNKLVMCYVFFNILIFYLFNCNKIQNNSIKINLKTKLMKLMKSMTSLVSLIS
jgi:hypothetical protein